MNYKKLMNEHYGKEKISMDDVREFIDQAPSIGKVSLKQVSPYTVRVFFKELDMNDYVSRMKEVNQWSNTISGFGVDMDISREIDFVDLYWSDN
jgi:hypothetical protein